MNLLKVGLTGGIAAGKSSVCQLFAEEGVPIIDADQIARDLFTLGNPLLSQLKQKFGSAIFFNNGELNRKALGNIVFNASEDLNWLNQLTHPEIAKEIKRQLIQIKTNTNSPYVILDIPLLIDLSGQVPAHLKPFIDRILVINTSLNIQIQRLSQRDKLDKTQALAIINNQSSLQQKLKLADDVIDNNNDIESLDSQVRFLHNHYINISN